MTVKRKIIVNILATIAFVFLFLLPILGFMATETAAGQTSADVTTHSGDYVFFIVSNDDVPLAAAPSTDISAYILWIGLASFALMMLFVYTSWYLSVRRNLGEMYGKMSSVERRAFRLSNGFFHPIRSYQLVREAEDTVASTYARYI